MSRLALMRSRPQEAAALGTINYQLFIINSPYLPFPFASNRVEVCGQSKAMLKLSWCFLGRRLCGRL